MDIATIMYRTALNGIMNKGMITKYPFFMPMLMPMIKASFYYVDCSVIQDYGQIETFDNEHTVYERIKVGTADATLGTNNSGGRTGYVLVWEKDGISHTIIGKISREELLRIAESIS